MTRATKSDADDSKGKHVAYYTPPGVIRLMISMVFKDHGFKHSIDESNDEAT